MEKIRDVRMKREKVIIFTQWIGMMELMEFDFKEEGIEYLVNYFPFVLIKNSFVL